MPFRKIKVEKCAKCGKSVYANEKLEAIGKVYHATCFRCESCDRRLTLLTYCEGPDKNPHCQTCYNSKFGPKGYGFGDTAIGEFEEVKKAVNAGLNSRSETYTAPAKPIPKAKSPPKKAAWQIKQAKKVQKSLAKKQQREADKKLSTDGNVAGNASSCSNNTGDGAGPSSNTKEKASKKVATWARRAKPRKMKIKKRAIPKCARCGKSVYANEKIEALGKDWHITCFHCVECKKRVTPITYCEGGDDELYCKPCYHKFFGAKGHGYGGAVH